MTSQRERAQRFRELHRPGTPLVLVNAWDAASARIFEEAGAAAIATTSAGLANALGYPDGDAIAPDLVAGAVRHITRTVRIPVSVDLESGYGTTPAAVAANVRAVMDAGGIGINIEDRLENPRLLVDKIAAIREVAGTADVPFFINARTDVYLRRRSDAAALFEDALQRLTMYEQAGADGLFAPGIADLEAIARLVGALGLPVNVMAFPGVPPVAELARAGVARVSMGSGPMRATLGLARRIARDVLATGTYDSFADAPSHAEINALFVKRDA
jgi:2-methylisocitrate lyase-like PEP mutase family enzyme